MRLPPRTGAWRIVVAVALATVAASVVTTGCSAGLGGPPSSRAAVDGEIRFTFAPDPIWDYMNETGIVDEWQDDTGYTIDTSATWDEFGLFAGGHADIISTASFEVPYLEEQTQRETVIIGRYNAERSRILIREDDTAQSVEDLRGKRIGVFTTVSGTLVWSALIKQMHELNLVDAADGDSDFEIVVADIQNLSNLLARGEIDACVCYPDLSARELRDGSVKPLYDGKSSANLFAELDAPGHDGPMGNVFVARADWVKDNSEEVSAFLDLWNRGLAEWRSHRDEIIERYPQHFAVSTNEDIDFMKQYVNEHDWIVDSVRFDQQWAEDESSVFDLMRSTDIIGDDISEPTFLPSEEVSR
ncbi:ABC transporter substrate-binding protein [Rhodococcus sp. BP-252]|uniref:Nitrate ABC transporter substrate-binding protein n=1 Tax=Rhodococcoides kyotonense TaxID=398843 RepID=A0A177YKV2_9NOCA|nr:MULTISPECIES: ABC transporter substrate-binding protein [Rhodococcus]MBY6410661.1 ABC transporter substrate-binding protein [Rhodococcus sp. BP-320]MBY6415514.1 ABC transporter substrate-binding protein [Rhodococcus sp. BP-321]MBY6420129.1 ABC transporter substrate-binding protein [Rhodococcus sp. BP-324]MBY6425217.1 ABC transporter substrate-binding protein [Rhodococcus sp. BP-323]MBY6430720.1 ABC transporter substrate-binding protein [Rhodococcus sp. BP-322]